MRRRRSAISTPSTTSSFDDANHAQRYANIFMPIMGNIGNILYVLTAFLGGLLICSGGSVPNLSFQNLFETGSMIAPLKIAVVASFLGHDEAVYGQRLAGVAADQRHRHGGGGREPRL